MSDTSLPTENPQQGNALQRAIRRLVRALRRDDHAHVWSLTFNEEPTT